MQHLELELCTYVDIYNLYVGYICWLDGGFMILRMGWVEGKGYFIASFFVYDVALWLLKNIMMIILCL